MNPNHKVQKNLLLILTAKIFLFLGLVLIIIQYFISFGYIKTKVNAIFNEAIDSSNIQGHLIEEFNNIKEILPEIINGILSLFLVIWISTIISLIFVNKKAIVTYVPFLLIFFVFLKIILLSLITFRNDIIANDLNFFAKSHDWNLELNLVIFKEILKFDYNDILNIISIVFLLGAIIIYILIFSYQKYDYTYKFYKFKKVEFKYVKIDHQDLYLFKD